MVDPTGRQVLALAREGEGRSERTLRAGDPLDSARLPRFGDDVADIRADLDDA